MFTKNFYFTLFLFFALKEVLGRRKLKSLVFKSAEVNYNPAYVSNYSLVIKEDRTSLNMLLEFPKDLPEDVWLHIVITRKVPKSEKPRTIFAYDVNVCNILSREVYNFNIVNLWLNNMMKFSNIPKKCPWPKGRYDFVNYRPEKDSVPGFILNGIYRVDSRFYLRDIYNVPLANATMFVDCRMK